MRELDLLAVLPSQARSIAFTPDGRSLVMAGGPISLFGLTADRPFRTFKDSAGLFRSVGFARVQAFARVRNFQTTLPLGVVTALETVVGWLPRSLGWRVSNLPILRRILEVELIATRR